MKTDVLIVGAGPTGLMETLLLNLSHGGFVGIGLFANNQFRLFGAMSPKLAAKVGLNEDPDLRLEERKLHQRFQAVQAGLFLIRPDGHIAYRGPADDLNSLRHYLDRLYLKVES